MVQEHSPRKVFQHRRRSIRRCRSHFRRHANRSSPPRAERRKRVHVRSAEHVLQPRIGNLQPGHFRQREPQLRLEIQQLQDEGSRLPLCPRHALLRQGPPLDFHGRTPDAPARLLADVLRDSRLDTPAPARLPCRTPHGTATDNPLPVPRHVGGTALCFPLRTLAVPIQVGLRPQHRQTLDSPRALPRLLRTDPPGDGILPVRLHLLRVPENPRQEGLQGPRVLRDALAVLPPGTDHHQLLPGIRFPGR